MEVVKRRDVTGDKGAVMINEASKVWPWEQDLQDVVETIGSVIEEIDLVIPAAAPTPLVLAELLENVTQLRVQMESVLTRVEGP